VCNIEKQYIPKEGVAPLHNHINSAAHIAKAELKIVQSRFDIEIGQKFRQFDFELLTSMAKSNIPYLMFESHFFKEFLPKYIGKKIKVGSFYVKSFYLIFINVRWRKSK
jgi:hypothetical protein